MDAKSDLVKSMEMVMEESLEIIIEIPIHEFIT